MKQRPWPIIVLSLLHIFAPIGNIYFNAWLNNRHASDYIQGYLSPGNHWVAQIYIGLPVLCGIAIYGCKKWSLYTYITLMLTLLGFDLYAYGSRAELTSIFPLISVFIVNILVVSYFLVPAVRAVYLDPRLRWWETAPRFRANFPTRFHVNGLEVTGETVNFSIGGVFLKGDQLPADKELVEIRFKYNEVDYKFMGNVIHHGQQNRTGVGVQFVHSSDSQKNAKSLAKQLHQDGRMMTDRLPGPEDSFIVWLKELLKTGKGLFPTIKRR